MSERPRTLPARAAGARLLGRAEPVAWLAGGAGACAGLGGSTAHHITVVQKCRREEAGPLVRPGWSLQGGCIVLMGMLTPEH